MVNSNTNIYKMKREIITFSKKITSKLSAPDKKFFTDMTYGILASQSCLLTKISHVLLEEEKKIKKGRNSLEFMV